MFNEFTTINRLNVDPVARDLTNLHLQVSDLNPDWGQRQQLPFRHLAAKPDGLVGHDAVLGQVHQDLDGLVVVDDPPASHHVTQAVHGVGSSEWVRLSRIATKSHRFNFK